MLGILELVLPDDIESISLVSKRIYQLAVPLLEEHRRLRQQYNTLKNKVQIDVMKWHNPGGLVADLLCKIMSDPRIGHYVKKMDVTMSSYVANDGWKPDEVFEKLFTTSRTRVQQNSKTRMDIIEEAIRVTEIIPTEEVDDWLHKIRSGKEDPLIALLFLHAPGLRTLEFLATCTHRESPYLLKTIQRIAGQGPTVKLYPSQLRNVDIQCFVGWDGLDFVKAFMSLPSLTSIKTDSLFVKGRAYQTGSATLPQPSNVSTFSVRSGPLPEKPLFELLRGMKSLKSFAYDFTYSSYLDEYMHMFDCLAVMTSLEALASRTLEHLKLSVPGIETSQIAPLRNFHALQEIEIKTNRCLAVDDSKIANISGVLPVSIEKLAISWHECTSADGVETLTKAILGLVRDSKTQLPRLRALHVDTMDQEETDALWDCLGSDETAQINTQLSFKIQGPTGAGEIPAWVDNVLVYG